MIAKVDAALAARLDGVKEDSTEARSRVKVMVDCGGQADGLTEAGFVLDLLAGPIAIGSIPLSRIVDLAARDEVVTIAPEMDTRPALKDSVPEIKADLVRTGALGLNGSGVVVGVVDSGIDIFHRSMRKDNGETRLIRLLDLTIRNVILVLNGPPPTGSTFMLNWTAPASAQPAGGGTPTTQTAAIPATATPAQIQAALLTLTGVTPTDIAVAGSALPDGIVTVDFIGRYEGKQVDPLGGAEVGNWGGASLKLDRSRDFMPDQINEALAHPDQTFPSRDLQDEGHGTHVIGTAAGDGSQATKCHGSNVYIGVAPAADLIAVKTGFTNADSVKGATYVFNVAADAGKPAVVNFSLGGALGALDGTDPGDVALDETLIENGAPVPGRAIVISAGNEGEGEFHSRKTVRQAVPESMQFTIGSRHNAAVFFNLWYDGLGRIDFQLTEPGGQTLTAAVTPANPANTYNTPLANHPLFVSSRLNHAQNNRHRIFCGITPVAGGNVAQGTWTITLTETTGTDTDVDCWLYGVPAKHPEFVAADRDRTRTITSPGTAINAITVGAYNPSDGQLAAFSSRGPIVSPASADHIKPDLSAPGMGIVAPKARVETTGCCHAEGCCCACCTEFYHPLQGTSMAAPHVTGVVALMLQRNGTQTFGQIRNLLRQHVRAPDPNNADGAAPNDNWGRGKLDAEAACTNVPHASVEPVLLPVAAYPDVLVPHAERLRAFNARIAGHPDAQRLAALVSTHADEVLRLLTDSRRVALAWHRMHGPALVRLILHSSSLTGLPGTLGGVPLADGLDRLLDALHRAGSPALRADIERHRALVLALPGHDLRLAG